MNDQIHTIPVLESLRFPEDCPFCVMRNELETKAVDFIMGPAYMEDDVRMETDRLGFCARHLFAMYQRQNRLGLALMLHTHIKRLNKETHKIIESGVSPLRFGKKTERAAARLRAFLAQAENSCYVCDTAEHTFNRYMDTFFTLWGSNKEAAELIKAVPGFCIPHFAALLAYAEQKLSKGKRQAFYDIVFPIQQRHMETMETDVEWFTLKFDYRNADAPWKNAKDALPRAIRMLGISDFD